MPAAGRCCPNEVNSEQPLPAQGVQYCSTEYRGNRRAGGDKQGVQPQNTAQQSARKNGPQDRRSNTQGRRAADALQNSHPDSRELLREAWRRIQAKGYTLGNVDVTIIAQAPKMLPHIPQMRVFIAEDLGCHMDDVNVKATTTEKLGFTGRGEGIACEAVALLVKASK